MQQFILKICPIKRVWIWPVINAIWQTSFQCEGKSNVSDMVLVWALACSFWYLTDCLQICLSYFATFYLVLFVTFFLPKSWSWFLIQWQKRSIFFILKTFIFLIIRRNDIFSSITLKQGLSKTIYFQTFFHVTTASMWALNL